MPLHIDARPQSLDEFFGNKEIIASLKEIIKFSDRPRTYLLQGATGNGKTTLARILAKEFGCEKFDVVELNAANMRGIDTIREITEKSVFAPMYGKSKCYILDESHQLTSTAQEALLKVIEDSPINTYFFLCTTNPARLIKTIKSRCAVYSVAHLNDTEMKRLIEYVMKKFNCEVLDAVVDLIIKGAKGCPRKALICLDKVKNLDDIEVVKENISDLTIEAKEFIELCRVIVTKDYDGKWKMIVTIYKTLNIEPEKVRKSILGYLKSCLIRSTMRSDTVRFSEMIDIFKDNVYDDGEPKLLNMLFKSTLK